MRCRNLGLVAIVCVAAILLGADTGASEETPKPADDPSAVPFDDRIGWLSGCLAIKNHRLGPGTPVTMIMLTFYREQIADGRDTTKRVAGKILGKTDSGEQCPALIEDRRGINEDEEVSFYAVSLEGGRTSAVDEFGIGIVGLDAEDADPIDLDGNGAVDTFSICTSSEGIHFAVWTDAPYTGKPLWTGYYYLFHGVADPDCPDTLFL